RINNNDIAKAFNARIGRNATVAVDDNSLATSFYHVTLKPGTIKIPAAAAAKLLQLTTASLDEAITGAADAEQIAGISGSNPTTINGLAFASPGPNIGDFL